MSQNDLPAILLSLATILLSLATIWLWGFSIGLEYGMRNATHARKDDDAPYSN